MGSTRTSDATEPFQAVASTGERLAAAELTPRTRTVATKAVEILLTMLIRRSDGSGS